MNAGHYTKLACTMPYTAALQTEKSAPSGMVHVSPAGCVEGCEGQGILRVSLKAAWQRTAKAHG